MNVTQVNSKRGMLFFQIWITWIMKISLDNGSQIETVILLEKGVNL